MNPALFLLMWVQRHRWAMLLVAILLLLLMSPLPGAFDRLDNLISPLAAFVVLAVTLCTARRFLTIVLMMGLTLVWLAISIATEGSGLFAGVSTVAPVLFLLVIGSVFLLLANWLAHVTIINAETLCAAICGYLIVGLFWSGIYALVQNVDHRAILTLDSTRLEQGDLIYFSYTTLTTTGFGDLVPKNPVARMAAVIEAVTGTFYVAIVIARFVTLYGFKPQRAE